MTQKRKAELQRKLSMAPVAKPPAGLSDRLKGDIPEFLSTRRDRERLSHSVAFSMRVAASILLLVTSVFLTMQLLSRDEHPLAPAAAADRVPSPVSLQAEADLAIEVPSEALLQPASPPPPARRQDAAPAVAEVRPAPPAAVGGATGAVIEERQADLQVAKDERSSVAVAQEVARDATAMAEDIVVTAPAAPPPPAVLVAPARSRAETAKAAASISRFAGPSASAFGISTDPTAFKRVKETIERGEEPAAPVDVAALINHFAGTPATAPRDVHLEVETSRVPVGKDNVAVIRYTVDTAVATTAKLTIHVTASAIEHRVFGGNVGLAEEVLAPGQSVTGLMEVRLRQPVAHGSEVARVVLEYRTRGKRPQKITQVIRAVDLMRGWPSASRRHRLATLAGIWGESLRDAEPDAEIVKSATSLAEEKPDDLRASELAAAAIASSRLRSSGPTGSGR